jgi:hypothetical protein
MQSRLEVRRALLIAALAGALSLLISFTSLYIINLPWAWDSDYFFLPGVQDLLAGWDIAVVVIAGVALALLAAPRVGFSALWILGLLFWLYRFLFPPFHHGLIRFRNVQHLLEYARELPYPFVEWTALCAPLLVATIFTCPTQGRGQRGVRVLSVVWLGVYALALYIFGRYPYGEIDPFPFWESSFAKGGTLIVLSLWPICVATLLLLLLKKDSGVTKANGAA